MKTLVFSLGCSALLTGCLEDVSFPQSVLFVMDNSASMQEEAGDFALGMDEFVDALSDAGISDYQLAVTTTSMFGDAPGTGGALAGDPGVVEKSEDNASQWSTNLLCNATCWQESEVPSDPDYVCDVSSLPDAISSEYLDCVCGSESWRSGSACGSGSEEGFEGTFLAMCRAVDDPPEDCFDDLSLLSDADIGSNAGLIREKDVLTVVIVSDEGDDSRRLGAGEDDPSAYMELFDQFDVPYRLAVIGPAYSCEDESNQENCELACNSGGATPWGARRYQLAAESSSGFYRPIWEEVDGECQFTDVSAHLSELAAALRTRP